MKKYIRAAIIIMLRNSGVIPFESTGVWEESWRMPLVDPDKVDYILTTALISCTQDIVKKAIKNLNRDKAKSIFLMYGKHMNEEASSMTSEELTAIFDAHLEEVKNELINWLS